MNFNMIKTEFLESLNKKVIPPLAKQKLIKFIQHETIDDIFKEIEDCKGDIYYVLFVVSFSVSIHYMKSSIPARKRNKYLKNLNECLETITELREIFVVKDSFYYPQESYDELAKSIKHIIYLLEHYGIIAKHREKERTKRLIVLFLWHYFYEIFEKEEKWDLLVKILNCLEIKSDAKSLENWWGKVIKEPNAYEPCSPEEYAEGFKESYYEMCKEFKKRFF